MVVSRFQRIRDHLRSREDRHEIRISSPPRHHMKMHMPRNSCSTGSAQIQTDVETVRVEGLSKQPQSDVKQLEKIESLLVFEVLEGRDVAIRDQHEVTIRVRVTIQKEETLTGSIKEKILFIFFREGTTIATKETSGGPSLAKDIGFPPRSPDPVHPVTPSTTKFG